jgi:hypothetical protein
MLALVFFWPAAALAVADLYMAPPTTLMFVDGALGQPAFWLKVVVAALGVGLQAIWGELRAIRETVGRGPAASLVREVADVAQGIDTTLGRIERAIEGIGSEWLRRQAPRSFDDYDPLP